MYLLRSVGTKIFFSGFISDILNTKIGFELEIFQEQTLKVDI